MCERQNPLHGKNGHPEFAFLPEKFRPSPESSVNLRELPVMQKVTEGQELVRVEQATMGETDIQLPEGLSLLPREAVPHSSGAKHQIQP